MIRQEVRPSGQAVNVRVWDDRPTDLLQPRPALAHFTVHRDEVPELCDRLVEILFILKPGVQCVERVAEKYANEIGVHEAARLLQQIGEDLVL